ncbi:GOLPH3/VPS74 family protein [Kibdelosporangium phytohabitans]|uniref:GPP34 family phosphoprotein n=1 Tax=Kibdelosporangium phytohabitans TaxID=860235 RepID=A0A0N9I289_9PSEU|nr:GPP34 family phosphoprotein [Kibdelosporangium phytohabitans]ALG08564.1 hypothetical protein AOZ06_18035 [Kibdelosporangium phytohabitans]MBE1470357.1 hypothetical protein [Kibdelosporangium phytohabitans]
MLVAHDLLLLMLDDESGKLLLSQAVANMGLAGAVMVDLTARGLIDLTGEHDRGRAGRLVVRSAPAPAEPVLRHGMDVVSQYQGRKPAAVVHPLSKGLREPLAAELVGAGILRHDEHKVMGLFRTTRLPANDSSHEAELRSHLWQVLTGEVPPDWRTGPLAGLLYAMNAVTTIITVPDKRAAKKRAKELSYGTWVPDAVRSAIQSTQAAAATSGTYGG